MKAVHWLRLGATVLLVLTVAAQLPQLMLRHRTEAGAQAVELAIDLPGTRLLAEVNHSDAETLLHRFRDVGIQSLVVWETTPKRLAEEGRLWLMQGDELREQGGWRFEQEPVLGTLARLGVLTSQVTVVGLPYSEDGEHLEALIRSRFPDPAPRQLDTVTERILIIPHIRAKVEETALGLDPADLQLAAAVGLRVIPRLHNFPGADETAIRSTFASLPADTSILLPAGDAVLGYPSALGTLAAVMQQRGIALALVETPEQLGNYPQAGQTELLAGLGHQAVRTLRIYMRDPRDLRNQLDRWLWPVKERNIRLVYLSPYLDIADQRGIDRHLTYVQRLTGVLQDNGYELGPARPFQPLNVGRTTGVTIGLALAAAGWLLLSLLLPGGHHYAEIASLAVAIALGVVLGQRSGPFWREGLALAIACVFPALASLTALEMALLPESLAGSRGLSPPRGFASPGRTWLVIRAALGFVIAVTIALAGGLLIATLLGDSRYLVEIRYFRGVKFSFVMPLIVTLWGYIRRCGVPGLEDRPWQDQLRDLWHLRLEVRHVVLAAVVGVLAVIYVFRGGHGDVGLSVSGTEHQFRMWLEQALWARPRLKEFAIGHPALLLLPALAVVPRRWGLLLAGSLAATVGTVSIVNTFEHLRTPLAVSLLRTWNGVWIGFALGMALLLVALAVLWIVWRWHARGGAARM